MYQHFRPESSTDTGLGMICTPQPTSGHLFVQCGRRQLSVDQILEVANNYTVTMQRPIEVVESENIPNNNNNSALGQQ